MAKRVKKHERQQALRRQKQQQRVIWGIGLTGVLLLLIVTAVSLSSNPSYTIDHTDNKSVALGQEVYVAQCASCHGVNLEGEANWQETDPSGLIKAPPHDETGHTWHHNDLYLIESINKGGARLAANVGISPMPAYENILSDEEVVAVLAYIKSTWPTDILAAQTSR